MQLNGWRKARWQITCLFLACRPGLGPAADLPSCSCKTVGQEQVPTVRDPAAVLRGNLCRGTCGVRRRTRLRAAGAALEQPRRVRSRSGCVLRHSHHPASTTPQARPQGVGADAIRAIAALGLLKSSQLQGTCALLARLESGANQPGRARALRSSVSISSWRWLLCSSAPSMRKLSSTRSPRVLILARCTLSRWLASMRAMV